MPMRSGRTVCDNFGNTVISWLEWVMQSSTAASEVYTRPVRMAYIWPMKHVHEFTRGTLGVRPGYHVAASDQGLTTFPIVAPKACRNGDSLSSPKPLCVLQLPNMYGVHMP